MSIVTALIGFQLCLGELFEIFKMARQVLSVIVGLMGGSLISDEEKYPTDDGYEAHRGHGGLG